MNRSQLENFIDMLQENKYRYIWDKKAKGYKYFCFSFILTEIISVSIYFRNSTKKENDFITMEKELGVAPKKNTAPGTVLLFC